MKPHRPKLPKAQLAYGSYRAADDIEGRQTALNGDGNYHADAWTRWKLQRLSRSLDRNAAMGSGPLTMTLGYLLGDGTWPRPRFAAGTADGEAITARWVADAQTTRFDADGILTLPKLLETKGRCVLRDGDAAAVHDGRGAVQLVESDRIVSPSGAASPTLGSPRIVQGVQFKGRKVIQYWITDPDTLGRIYPGRAYPYPAGQVSFTAHRDGRASQVRGVPILSPSLDDLDHLDSLGESEIRSAETSSLISIGMKRLPTANGPAPSAGVVRSGPGLIFTLPEGYEPVDLNNGRPNLNVPEFQRLNMRIAYMVMGLPLELLLLDLNQLNYSAARSLRNLAEDNLGSKRRWLFHPMLGKMLTEWLTVEGYDPALAEGVTWDWPRLQLHDRIKEAEGDKAELDNGTTSLQRLTGHDCFVILDEQATVAQYRDAQQLARIIAAHQACESANLTNPGLNITWQQIITAPGAATPAAPVAPVAPVASDPVTDPAASDPANPTLPTEAA